MSKFAWHRQCKGTFSPKILRTILCLFSPRFSKLECNTISDLRFSQPDVVLHSNADKYRKCGEQDREAKEWSVNTNPGIWQYL